MPITAILSEDRREILIRGVNTHIVAEELSKELNEFLLGNDLKLYFFFEGAPGPLGEGLIIRVRASRKLGGVDITALNKFFSSRRISFIVK